MFVIFENMFTKHIKIVQLLLLYCVVVQSYVIPENRSLRKDANSFQDLCNDIDEENVTLKLRIKFRTNLYSFFWLAYKWSSSLPYHSNGGRSFNLEHSLEDENSVLVEESDYRIKDREITADDIIQYIEVITSSLDDFRENVIVKDAVTESSPNLSKDIEIHLTRFVIMVYQWSFDVMTLNILDNSYHERFVNMRNSCISQLKNYTLADRLVNSSDIISEIKIIVNKVNEEPKKLSEEKKLSDMAYALLILITSIESELDERLKFEENIISTRLNNELFRFQFIAYTWVLHIRYPNIFKNSVNKNSQSPLEDQSSRPMGKNDNRPTDQENNTADVLEHENKSSTIEGIDVSTKCKFKQTIRHTLEMQLFIFTQITHEWLSDFLIYGSNTARGRSFNDFQLPLDEQSFSLPMEDKEITIKDFMDNVKLTKRQINENLKAVKEIIMNKDNDFLQTLRNLKNHTHHKRSAIENHTEELKFLQAVRLEYIMVIYRWLSNMIISTIIGETSLGDFLPHLLKCQRTFPVKNITTEIIEFQEISQEIIYLTKLLQATASEI
ncbi:PREDICTED: uncharacterized protein LOC108755344 [Trachymyrmex septentrionalis]|uniref:uncharacterized protein LOC108755344 n=1 Tax=Trachymyrmex septentrionalis TaxID=34720 RepID=UPI00084ED4C7|nr:PREDICTED: uncharacterized protein LOC108755344 [Trachymyrmex septentrionalis]